MLSPFSRSVRSSLVTALLALSVAACSSSDGGSFLDPDYGDTLPSEPGGTGVGETGGDVPPPGDEPDDDGTGGADDDGGLPPEPDDDGIDNGSEEPEDLCDDASDVTLYLSPDDSNSMSSPVQVREAVLGEWGSVEAVAIRTWEFFNYYRFDYPAAEPGQVVVSPSLHQPDADEDGEYLLQIGVSSELLDEQTRAPMAITLVLDTSGSMEGRSMDMLKESSMAIAASLREGDTISIVTWATDNQVRLERHEVTGPDDPTLLAEIEALEPGGSTDLHGGLVAGYELAQSSYAAGLVNRIVLVSDGGANAGLTDVDLIAQYAGSQDEDGIYMVGVGVGDPLSYHDDLMDVVTDVGKGASVFIADPDEAWSIFHDDFISTMAVAARDVQVRLDMPPGFEIVSTSAEEVSTDVSEVEPQHLAPNDTMVFHQRIRTCAPELLDEDASITVTVRYRDAVTFETREVVHEQLISELLQQSPAQLLKGAAIFSYAESLKAYKKADLEGRASTTEGAFRALERAEAVLEGDADLAEIRAVLEALADV
ncbi:MAG: VWA domain-containing protein [Myxococcota bacterium]